MGTVRNFLSSTSGNVGVFFALAAVPTIVMMGAGVDLGVRQIAQQKLQEALDNGVLAAASKTQTNESLDVVVSSYLEEIGFSHEVSIQQTNEITETSRSVAVRAEYSVPTSFLSLLGIAELPVVAISKARDQLGSVEISLVLDMSGSMRNLRIKNTKAAAKSFVETMLDEDEGKDNVTISIVPFAGSVNVGDAVFDKLGGKRDHNYSSCFFIKNVEYGFFNLSFQSRKQVERYSEENPSFDPNKFLGRYMEDFYWCPEHSSSIVYPTSDLTKLNQSIDDLWLWDGTGTQYGLQWGGMLLDPAGKSITSAAISVGEMNSSLAELPRPYSESKKILVLMTDGVTSGQPLHEVDALNARKVTKKACDAIKSNGITIFTIFANDGKDNNEKKTAQEDLTYCASSPQNFFWVEDKNINDAFDAVAAKIKRLKLV